MESNKQEKSNLLNDNPIARRAGGSWMSKHSIAGGSPLHKGGSALYQKKEEGFTTYNNRTNKDGVGQHDLMNLRFNAADAAGKAYEAGTGTYNAYEKASDKFNVSRDSIGGVNKRIDRVLKGEEFEFKKPDGSPAQQKRKKTGGEIAMEAGMVAGSTMTAAQKKKMRDESVFGPDGKNVAKPPKGKEVKCAPGQVKILGKCVTGANPKPKGTVKKSPIKNKSTEKGGGKTHGEMTKKEMHNHSMVHHLAKNPSSGKDKIQTAIDKARDNKKKKETKKSPINNNEGGQAHSQLGKKELRTHMKVKHGKKSPKVQLAKQPKVKVYKTPTFTSQNYVPAKAEPVYKVKRKK